MSKVIKGAITFALLFLCQITQAQGFFNLTAKDVKIDSILPCFAHSKPLAGNYQDSVYTVKIKYPEFMDMPARDIKRYKAISNAPLHALPVITQKTTLNRKSASLDITFCPIVYRDNKYQLLVSFMLDVQSSPLPQASKTSFAKTRATTMASRYTDHSVLASGTWAKIRVPASGVYQVTDELIRKAGFTDINKVKVYGYGGNLQNETLTAADLQEYDDLKEVATCMVNGRKLFYARGPVSWDSATTTTRTRNPYSDYGYYLITSNDAQPLTVDSTTFISSFYPSNDDYHTLHEVDDFAWFQGGRNLFESTPINNGSSHTFSVPTTGLSTTGTVAVAVTAGSNGSANVSFNGTDFGTATFTWSASSSSIDAYAKGKEVVITKQVDNIGVTNDIKITTISGGTVRLDYISITSTTPRPAPSIVNSSFPSPEYVYNITNQDHHADEECDMVIIIPTSQKLLSQAQRLASFHAQHDGLRVRVVPADELFNEFSSGTPDASAYRRYLKMLYDRAETEADMPKSLLLFGDCAWDNRMNTSDWAGKSPDDYLLTFESDNSFNDVLSYVDDGFFCLLDDGEGANTQTTDKLDMGVGRFPVATESDAKIIVDKTINYATNTNAGAWENILMFLGDDGNNNIFMDEINDAANHTSTLYPGYLTKKVMWDSYTRVTASTGNTYPEVADIIKQQQATGALVFDYTGHGRPDQMSHEAVLRLNDFQGFTNTNLPLWIAATCDIMPFDGTIPNIGEAAVLNPKGGAVAFYGTARTVYDNYNIPINEAFMRYVLSKQYGKPISLGEAQRLAKNHVISTGQDLTINKLQYSLLGDPALALNQPTLSVVIDTINGVDIASSSTPVNLAAGSIAMVKGHVESVPSSFDGIMTATVRDKSELVTCRLNDNTASGAYAPFQYYDRQNILFSGSDSVKGGEFEFSFAVPKDINYDLGPGLMNIYAVNNDHTLTANGSTESFNIGGSSVAGTDSVGPSMFVYLNSPSFINSGDVNTTPYFVAEVQDEDGINATGNGIGHDMRLVIDGDMSKTYVLNDNFVYDFGSYTSGTTYYGIPALTPGPHTLTFRSWDVLNNPSTTQLDFNVVEGLDPRIFSVSTTKNPASTTTTFIITHDRVGSDMDVEIEVFDTVGRILWRHKENGVSPSNTYTVDWDLTTDNGGRLQTGVYLYRASVSSDGSSRSSKAKKLIVINNN